MAASGKWPEGSDAAKKHVSGIVGLRPEIHVAKQSIADNEMGWDWLSVQLGEGSELMLYRSCLVKPVIGL